jgi:predicted Zn-dependent protease
MVGVPQPELATVLTSPAIATSAPQPPTSSAIAAAVPQPPAAAAATTAVPTMAPKSAHPMGGAGQALVAQAEAKSASGDLTGAASYLERAVRVEPQHPLPWNRLARVRLAQGSHALAAQLAQKSNALVGDDRALKRDNWMIISEARRGEGDLAAAEEARRVADGLR